MRGLALFLWLAVVYGKKQNGMNFLNGQWSANKYNTADALSSFASYLSQTNANFLSLTFCWYQWDVDTPGPVYQRVGITPTDTELTAIIDAAHGNGTGVLMRPCVDPDWSNPKTQGTWRGMIGRNFTAQQWDQWFASFTEMTVHYAQLAQSLKVELFSVGLEYIDASRQTAHWEDLVNQVRSAFRGRITYGANHGNEDNIQWWSSVDVIGVDAYYPLAPETKTPSVDDLVKAWAPIVGSLSRLSTKWNKTIIFSEIGYCSSPGTNVDPAHCGDGGVDLNAQVTAYTAFFQAVYPLAWFEGVHWWAWTTATNGGGGTSDSGFSPSDKPVAAVIKKYYSE